jgi:hypothetical protein
MKEERSREIPLSIEKNSRESLNLHNPTAHKTNAFEDQSMEHDV